MRGILRRASPPGPPDISSGPGTAAPARPFPASSDAIRGSTRPCLSTRLRLSEMSIVSTCPGLIARHAEAREPNTPFPGFRSPDW
ncbi:hypothetical protein CTZ28_13695 [Streptomyces shenzhenensis]|uniref:Uncharacterized protein n=1 Tax=Streptomyces shenzhenensis TaxID=943815 RepID=A0A3M0I6M9_9ACTN|nr:hypothetical protein CTZ28_13695 [Streptomyces shenzhenensis]